MGKSPEVPPPVLGQGPGDIPKAQRTRTPVFSMSFWKSILHLEEREAVVKERQDLAQDGKSWPGPHTFPTLRGSDSLSKMLTMVYVSTGSQRKMSIWALFFLTLAFKAIRDPLTVVTFFWGSAKMSLPPTNFRVNSPAPLAWHCFGVCQSLGPEQQQVNI